MDDLSEEGSNIQLEERSLSAGTRFFLHTLAIKSIWREWLPSSRQGPAVERLYNNAQVLVFDVSLPQVTS